MAVWAELDAAYVEIASAGGVTAQFGDYEDSASFNSATDLSATLSMGGDFAALATAAMTSGEIGTAALAINLAFIELGNDYVEFLENNPPILDIAKERGASDPGQSFHENILGNIQDNVVADRFTDHNAINIDIAGYGTALPDGDPRSTDAQEFGDRGYFSGYASNSANKIASVAWDLEHGISYTGEYIEAFNQGFEGDHDGIIDGGGYGDITIVSSGTGTIVSPEGGSHAVFEQTGTPGGESGSFTRFDSYRTDFGSGFSTEVKIYLDTDWAVGEGFDYSVAANSQSGGHVRDFIFHITKDDSGDIYVGANNNTDFDPLEDMDTQPSTMDAFAEISESGWYTFQHFFFDAGDGSLAVAMVVYDSTGKAVFTDVLNNPADSIESLVGGNRYGWFTNIDIAGGIEVDEVKLLLSEPIGVTKSGTSGSDDIEGTNFDDLFLASEGSDSIDGLDGSDTYSFDNDALTPPVDGGFADLQSGVAYSDETGVDLLTSIENLKGSDGDDELNGDANDNTFFSSGGHDEIDGRGGEDTFDASEADDTVLVDLNSGHVFGDVTADLTSIENVVTGSGDDVIVGSTDDNEIDGGDGIDTVVETGDYTDATIEFVDGSFEITTTDGGTDTLTNVEQVNFDDAEVWLVSDAEDLTDALANAGEGAIIKLADGVYEGEFTIATDGLTIESLSGDASAVVIKGEFKTLNNIGDSTQLDEWIGTPTAYTGTGAGLTVNADNVSLNNLTITEFRTGLELQDSDGLTIDGVVFDENIHSIYKEDGSAEVSNFTLTNSSITHSYHGLITNAAVGAGSFDGITISNVLFEHLTEKGIYVEQLSNAEIFDITMNDVGQFGRGDAFGTIGESGTGIDINLKFGDYQNISIHDFAFTDVGLSNGGGTPHFNGSAIAIKARDDGGTYGSNPATLDNVSVTDGTIDGNSTGIRVGEPGKTTDGPTDITIENVENTSTAVDAWTYDNQTDTPLEISLTDGGDTATTHTGSTGVVNYSGGDGADTLNGSAQDETFEGGAGNDTIDGGAGIDTVNFDGSIGDFSFGVGSVTVKDNNTEDGDLGTDDLTGVETLEFNDATVLVVGAGSEYATIQDAIDAAGAGDTILISEGTYAENLSVDKALNFISNGQVTINPSSGNAVTLEVGLDGDVSFDGIDLMGAGTNSTLFGIHVATGANVGTLSLSNGTISGFGSRGIWTTDDGDPGTYPTLGALDITNFGFSSNGNGGGNTAHIKLYGFDGSINLDTVTFEGGTGLGDVGILPDSAIEVIGALAGPGTATPTPAVTPDVDFTINNVDVTGSYHKNPIAIFQFNEIDGLDITDLDLSGAESSWGPLFNLDGIADDDIDASGLDITFPTTSSIHTELQGEKTGQGSVDSTITGTAGNDSLHGKSGNDTLNGGDGDDILYGGNKPGQDFDDGPGDDTLNGGAGDDELYGGIGNDTLNGGSGNNTLDGGDDFDAAVGYDSSYSIQISGGQWIVTNGTDTDTLTDVESVTIDGQVYLLVDDDAGNGFTSVQDAIDAATGGETILIAPGTYTENANYNPGDGSNTGTGNPVGMLVNKDNITLQGVDANGDPIIDAGSTDAAVNSGVQSNWGTNFFITGNGVSILGLTLNGTAPGSTINKVIEVVGDDFTLQNSYVGGPDGLDVASTIYINDRDASGSPFTSDITSFLVDNNILEGSAVVTNGPGVGHLPEDVSFIISDNEFVMNTGSTFGYNVGIILNGEQAGIPWRLQSIQLPELTGNSFSADYELKLRATDDDPTKLPDRAWLDDFVANNDIGEFAFVADQAGEPKLVPYMLTNPYGAGDVDSNYIYLRTTVEQAEAEAEPGDKIVVKAAPGTIDVTVDDLTVEVLQGSGQVTLELGAGVEKVTLDGSEDVNVNGNAEDNTIEGNDGDNVVDGGDGEDTFVADVSTFGDFNLTQNVDGSYTLVHSGGTDTLIDIENLSNGTDVVDIELLLANIGPQINDITDPQTGAVLSVDEGSANGTVVANVDASDDQEVFGDTLTYSLQTVAGGTFTGPFSINANGDIVVAGSLDFETINSYDFKVVVTDSKGNTATQDITVGVGDVNEGLGGLATETVEVEAGSRAADLNMTALVDPDSDPLSYEVTSLPTDGTVKLANGSALSVGQVLTEAQFLGLVYNSPETAQNEGLQFNVSDGTNDTTLTVTIDVQGPVNATYRGTDNADLLDGAGGNDTVIGFRGFDTLFGGSGDDKLLGNKGNDTLFGQGGEDTLLGHANNDFLFGGANDDVLKGGGGADILNGGRGDDRMFGNHGKDTFVFGENDGNDRVFGFSDNNDVLDLSAFGYASKAEAKSHFFEIGGANNNKVGWSDGGTTIVIKGMDLSDVDNNDVLI